MPQILKGLPVAEAITEDLIARTTILKEHGIEPALAILRVGKRPDDISYETGAKKRCNTIGIKFVDFHLPEDCSRQELLAAIDAINQDPTIHGCLMFRPLLNKDDEEAACARLLPTKDVDCMSREALGNILIGNGSGYPPCTVQACLEILDYYGIPLAGKRVTVIGRSLVIGKPLSMMLQERNATVTMCHTKTIDLPKVCRNAEILVVAAGKAGIVDARFVNQSQTVIDVGINVDAQGKLCGDVLFDEVSGIVDALTPVPGGVGSITTAVLAKHVIEAAEKTTRYV